MLILDPVPLFGTPEYEDKLCYSKEDINYKGLNCHEDGKEIHFRVKTNNIITFLIFVLGKKMKKFD